MSNKQFRTYLIRWLYAASLTHFAVGLLLPWISHLDIASPYYQLVEQHFFPQLSVAVDQAANPATPSATRAMQIWWLSLFGPTVQTVGIWMGALTFLGDRHHSRFAWAALMAGTLVWAPQDMWISMQAQMHINVWIDCIAVLLLIPPLACLWKMDRAETERKS